jgi:hypothetical protein
MNLRIPEEFLRNQWRNGKYWPCSKLSAKKRKMPIIVKSDFGKRLKHSISLL